MKVTHSILVQNDLVDCLFDGLIVDAHGITIDLNGHTLDGKGVGAAVRNIGFDNVTIKNGRMVDWDWGVALNTGTRRNIVENIRPEQTQEAAIGLGHIAEPDPSLPVRAARSVPLRRLRRAGERDPRQHDHRQRPRCLGDRQHAAHA